jgi:hypothetical protein
MARFLHKAQWEWAADEYRRGTSLSRLALRLGVPKATVAAVLDPKQAGNLLDQSLVSACIDLLMELEIERGRLPNHSFRNQTEAAMVALRIAMDQREETSCAP